MLRYDTLMLTQVRVDMASTKYNRLSLGIYPAHPDMMLSDDWKDNVIVSPSTVWCKGNSVRFYDFKSVQTVVWFVLRIKVKANYYSFRFTFLIKYS